jgi:hypothetical protein
MIYKFKDQARIPDGVTPGDVVAEMDQVRKKFGKATPANATEAVIRDPASFMALRAFGPESPDAAFRDGIHRGITYAMRALITVEEEAPSDGPEVRAYFIVEDGDGDRVYVPLKIIAENPDLRKQLWAELRRDANTFARKQRDTFDEMERLVVLAD